MDVHTRHQMILEELRQRSPVLVGELAVALDCSEMTVRRDLESLERIGALRRVHGGATSVFLGAEETPYGIRALELTGAKAAIGAAAASILADRETVILDGGTTVMEVGTSAPEPPNDRHAAGFAASLRVTRMPWHQTPPPGWRGPPWRVVIGGESC